MFLYINTSSHEKIILALFDKSGKVLVMKKIKAVYQQSEKLLSEIDKILSNVKCQMSNVGGIFIVIGPGGFTSLRISIATANTMAWSLNIPILGVENKDGLEDKALLDKNFKKILNKTKFKQVLPKYGKEPNITKSKK